MPEKTPFRWSRGDAVITQLILVIGLVLVGLATAYALVWITPLPPADGGPVGTITVPVPDGVADPAPPVAAASADYTVESTGSMAVVLHDPTTVQRLLLVLPSLLGLAATITVMVNLLRIVRSLDAGDPFTPANARRIQVIGIAVQAGAVLSLVAATFRDGVLTGAALGTGGLELSLTLGGGGGAGSAVVLVFVGMLLLGLAEVFRRGTRMRDDVRGLV
ncbi:MULTISPECIES: DUF2975 domain-containing protein [unclassified Nocardiopsis]|uniref:DUF2975 domain-containing protein n=1 Tax=Nocardiopsis TaxID=2013 RepID=UPI00387B6D56